jgi:hypothetical protein
METDAIFETAFYFKILDNAQSTKSSVIMDYHLNPSELAHCECTLEYGRFGLQ